MRVPVGMTMRVIVRVPMGMPTESRVRMAEPTVVVMVMGIGEAARHAEASTEEEQPEEEEQDSREQAEPGGDPVLIRGSRGAIRRLLDQIEQ